MAITIEIDTKQNLRVTRFTGVVTDDELTDYAERLRAGFDPALNAIVDLQSSDLRLSAAGVRAIAAAMQTPPTAEGERKVAIVAGDDLSYGFGRMYELIHSSPADVRVFREFDEALNWVIERA